MKKIFAAAIAAISCAAAAETKIATVDMAELVRLDADYPRDMKAISEKRAGFEEQLFKMQEELEALGADLRKQSESLQTPNPMLNPSVLEDARRKFDADRKRFATLQQQFMLKTQECDNILGELRSLLSRNAAEKTRATIAKFAKEKGYTLVIDSGTTVWSADGVDVTEEVLKFAGIDAEAARAAAKEAEEGARQRLRRPAGGGDAPVPASAPASAPAPAN